MRALIERGYETAIFTRAQTHCDETLAVTRYVGDRDGDLGAIPREGWDAVIDTNGYVPAIVAASCAHLATAGRYLFTSSISVYDPTVPIHGDGCAPYAQRIVELADADPENYGPSKRRSEDVVRAVFDDRVILVRPGVLAGPYDPTNRFTYWVDRFAEGGDVAVPGPADRYIQFIDVRDAAAFMIQLLEQNRSGIYDINGYLKTTMMENFAATALETLGTDADIVWVDERFLEKLGITGWIDLPLWLGPSHCTPGFMNTNIDRALADGLSLRPLAETIRDTRAWSTADASRNVPDLPAGISRERERAILAAWKTDSPELRDA